MSEQPRSATIPFVATVSCKDGAIQKSCSGEIKAADAERLAAALVELAVAIRSEARRDVFSL